MTLRTWVAAAACLATAAQAGLADNDVRRVADTLAAGNVARSPSKRASAARILAGLGAHPLDGGEDYAATWAGGTTPRSAPLRERALGPGYRRVTIEPNGSARFDQTFLAGRLARVAVAPVRNVAFRLEVSGDGGQSYCSGGRSCEWVPAYTQRFQVRIDNRAHQPAEFFVVMP
jgi:hypothetical protein